MEEPIRMKVYLAIVASLLADDKQRGQVKEQGFYYTREGREEVKKALSKRVNG